MQRQVIIDAQILEITLNDSFRFGIQWQYLASRIAKGTNIQFRLGVTGNIDNNPLTAITLSSEQSADNAWSGIIDALQTFGTVKVVSNPHVRARHGQPAMFTSGTSQSYVNEITREEDTDSGQVTYTINTAKVFDGILLGVIPFINNKQEANLQIFPIKSQVDQNSLALQEIIPNGGKITLPKVEIKNVSTNVKVHNNDIVILGGLIDKYTSKDDQEVPGLGRIPLLGWLFKGKNNIEQVRELVIIMRIKII